MITKLFNDDLVMEKKIRIRKLTPKECFRLMGVRDADTEKILAQVSNSQAYKMAGNSIVVDCMVGLFENLFIDDKPKAGTQLELF